MSIKIVLCFDVSQKKNFNIFKVEYEYDINKVKMLSSENDLR